ncbi:MAG: cysteine hydrolase family protein [Pseudorhodoplanes sp.]
MADALLPIPLNQRAIHLCIDMQRIFSVDGVWPAPWMERVLPVVGELVARFPERTVFTRFITPDVPEDMPGMWQRYYRRWRAATRSELPEGSLDLMPALARFVPPATVIDKTRYSAFSTPQMLTCLHERGINSLIITGSETDVCVLATVLDAVDLGFRVIVVRDAVCSSSDAGHDALLRVYHGRYSEQIETASAEDVLRLWT